MKRILAIIVFILLGSASAHAECVVPPTNPSPDGINFLLGMDPSDGILDAWCRIQSLQGEYKVTVNFLEAKAKRSFDISFDGTPSKDRMEFATLIQSMLPTYDAPALDENGMNFGDVLQTSVQPRAAKSPESKLFSTTTLGVPPVYDFADDIILWAPVTIDVYPITIADVNFTLRVSFRPSFGRYLMAKSGTAEELILKGWRDKVLRHATPFQDTCPDNIPNCKDLEPVVDIHTAWVLNAVTLHAEGSGLSAATMQLFSQLAADNPKKSSNPLSNFSPTEGSASFDIRGEYRSITAKAFGDTNRIAGTQEIEVQWLETQNSKKTYSWMLEDYAKRTREAMVLQNPSQN